MRESFFFFLFFFFLGIVACLIVLARSNGRD